MNDTKFCDRVIDTYILRLIVPPRIPKNRVINKKFYEKINTMIIDRNDLDIPTFIDGNFFQRALQTGLNELHINIKKVSFTMGSKPGENYCSMIYRASVTFTNGSSKEQNLSLIVKSLPINVLTESFQKMGVFDRETDMYVEALDKISDILSGERIAPKFFYYTKDPIETMVFEDVTPLGYILADRVKGLDEDHCALVLRKIGKYHAASMIVAEKYPQVYEKFNRNLMTEETDEGFKMAINKNFELLQKAASTWPGFEEIAKKLDKFGSKAGENLRIWCEPNDAEIKVLCHNDLWTNNILFKYENDTLANLYFIDFQMAHYSSPGIDITHFLYTSPEFHLLANKRDHMIEEYYYKSLKETLDNSDYKGAPNLSEILDEIEKREIVGFTWAAMKLFLICMDKDKCGENSLDNLADAEKGEKIRAVGMSSKRYIDTMQYILRRMETLNIFDKYT